jgi:16S rRNA processing protein RimM
VLLPLQPEVSPPGDLIEVGRVIGGWGVQGWIKVQPFSGSPAESVLIGIKDWWLQPTMGIPGRTTSVIRPGASLALVAQPLRVERTRVHSDRVVARPAGFEDRSQADAIRGRIIAVSRSAFPPAGDESFYWVDLIGCVVVNTHEQSLGQVISVDDHGAHALLRVAEQGAPASVPARLIPFVANYVLDVDMAARRIRVDWELDY